MYSFTPVPRIDVYRGIIDGKLSVYGGRVLVVNPATDVVIQRIEVDYDVRHLLTGRHRKARTISRAIRNRMPNMYKPEQVMRIYRRIARNHGIDLEQSNLGNSRVRFKARNAVLAVLANF